MEAISSGVRSKSSAAAASSKCRTFVAPMIGDVTPLAHCQAKVTRAIGMLCRSATFCTGSTMAKSLSSARSYFPCATLSVALRRVSADPGGPCQMVGGQRAVGHE